jgi:hypothetical protein
LKYSQIGYVTSRDGTRLSGEVNQLAIQVMKECGIDISNQKSKIITEDIIRNATKEIMLMIPTVNAFHIQQGIGILKLLHEAAIEEYVNIRIFTKQCKPTTTTATESITFILCSH